MILAKLQSGTIWPILFVVIIIATIVGLFIYHVIMYPNGKKENRK
jgi:hypothetical protein